MKYKFISILYKPLKFIFNNIIYLIKLSSAIIAILSLFNISLLYYNFDILNEAINLINNVINYIKNLISKWVSNDEDDETSEPVDFLTYRKKIKVIEQNIQHPTNNSYWILPLMIIGYGAIYYYNPHSNLEENKSLELNQTKWFRFIDKGSISIKSQIYTLVPTANKRNLIYTDNKLVFTEAFILDNDQLNLTSPPL